jgi:pimeloyl-ACP methyl ester carboxylesterase
LEVDAKLPLQNLTLESGATLTYRELGSAGPVVLLLHGWPTSSYLWRNVMPTIAESTRVLAPDLPGFGGSDKPLDQRYDFKFFGAVLDEFLAASGVEHVIPVGHDIGGPVALWWAMRNRSRVPRLALLNTLVYPEFDDAVVAFVRTLMTPGAREEATSPEGLAEIMRLGVVNADVLTDEVIDAVVAPFRDDASRLALANAGIGLSPKGFAEMARELPRFDVPVRLIYGEQDKVLPDVAVTMRRLALDLRHAEVTALPDCGHFLQEEEPEEVAALLAAFVSE